MVGWKASGVIYSVCIKVVSGCFAVVVVVVVVVVVRRKRNFVVEESREHLKCRH